MDTENTTNLFQLINELISHLIWPLILLLIAFLFREKIAALFNAIKRIKFSDFEADFEEREKKFAEEDISPLIDEVEGLTTRLKELENKFMLISETKEKNEIKIDVDAINNRISEALKNNSFKWRSISKLASVSGTSEDTVLDILRKDDKVTLSKGKSGRRIARLRDQ